MTTHSHPTIMSHDLLLNNGYVQIVAVFYHLFLQCAAPILLELVKFICSHECIINQLTYGV